MKFIKTASVACILSMVHVCGYAQLKIENNTVEIQKDLKINQIQVLGTHNSYAKKRDTVLVNFINPMLTKMMGGYTKNMTEAQKMTWQEYHPNTLSFKEMLAYDFPSFEEQLNAGIRSLAIDIVYDPEGGRFSKPAIYDVLKQKGIHNYQKFDDTDMDKPGFKVMHIPDLDFRSNYNTFEAALKALKTWSTNHPKHSPIFILVEAKDDALPVFPNATKVLPFDEKAYQDLDAQLIQVLGREKIITPDDVRGNYNTLEQAVLAKKWPTVQASLGKFIFLLLPGGAGLKDEGPYLKGHPSLKGRTMFVKSSVGKPHSAFLLLDNASMRKQDITAAVNKGYMVRTRSDIETYEAKMNDKTRANAAFESGAQIISTDFYKSGNAYGTDYIVEMPNKKVVRENPINGIIK
ncbi:Ca2+-dependent phosphoinositide-specific phospholipase C [Pedobacter sp. MW01-1-1]|uniref:Ca2+-dependent phosphoinositide-specific phospholipase C n=1 Tax=Pedobacter sp. MW01-1-1 TaxID=3383027 RepID=UPI003FF03D11